MYGQSTDRHGRNFPAWYQQSVLTNADRSVRESFVCRLEQNMVLARRSTVLSQVWGGFPCISGPKPSPSLLLPLLSMLQSPYVEQEQRFLLWPRSVPMDFAVQTPARLCLISLLQEQP